MRPPRLLTLTLLLGLAAGCESVSGLDQLEFVPPDEDDGSTCVADPIETTCAGLACGDTIDNCGDPITCPDTCVAPTACGAGGVDPNSCGCTGGVNLTPEIPECVAVPGATGNTYYKCPSMSFAAGRALCQQYGTDLVVVTSAAENDLVRSLVSAGPDNAWLGLFDADGCTQAEPCEFLWVDGTSWETQFGAWGPGEPNNTGGGEHCAELSFANGQWNDVPCANVLSIVCETTCPAI